MNRNPVGAKENKKLGFRSHFISFLLGVSVTYLVMKPSSISVTLYSQESQNKVEGEDVKNEIENDKKNEDVQKASSEITSLERRGNEQEEKNFYSIGRKLGTDKVQGPERLPGCLKNDQCTRPGCVRKECRPWGHWYHTLYQQRIGKYSLDTTEPFQFLEIGFFNGRGYDTYREFFAKTAEVHSMEISCLPEGKVEEGKWPWGNFAEKNPRYQQYLDEERLHCGDAFNFTFLDDIWRNKMRRKDAPPLKIVVDDGSHLSSHMALSVFYWFPRIEPGGLLVIEDIQPISDANMFRTQFLPQVMSDLHYCGDPKEKPDAPCFPLVQKLLQSIHCEMHICIFERNQEPAIPNLPIANSTLPPNTFDAKQCQSIGNPFGRGLLNPSK